MHGDRLSAEELSELSDQLASGPKDLYGERYRGLVLYGSYARGRPTRVATWTYYFCSMAK